ncbi:hypothetical protein [Paludisphaera mucosa]|uniref:Uncharacterized protein n=1 Tax=Paludisphaera mucosa TaxID=3030827 RepID=A0ABT6FJ11_9BACT|nr:hypothetical protein [Paludisphaera mucosa]MDG3007539.1 hypothetical protein [Paludisphaera mucosa]
MPPLILFLHLLVLLAAMLLAAFLAVVLAIFAATALLVAFVLHKLGWDRRLIAYLVHKQRGRTSPPVKVWVDDLDAPIEARWSFDDPAAKGR